MSDKKYDVVFREGGIKTPFGILGGETHVYGDPSDSLLQNPDIVIKQKRSWGGAAPVNEEIAKYYPKRNVFVVSRVTGEGRSNSSSEIVIPADPQTVNRHPALRGRVWMKPRSNH